MKRIYLIILSNEYDRGAITAFFDKNHDDDFWFHSLPNSIFIKTTKSAKEIADILDENFGEHGYFVTEITHNYWGRLPGNHWPYIKNKDSKSPEK
jgi:hypothetical protein